MDIDISANGVAGVANEIDSVDKTGSLGSQTATTLGYCIPWEKFSSTLALIIAPEEAAPGSITMSTRGDEREETGVEQRSRNQRSATPVSFSRIAQSRAMYAFGIMLKNLDLQNSYGGENSFGDEDANSVLLEEIAGWIALRLVDLRLPALEVLQIFVVECRWKLPDGVTMMVTSEIVENMEENDGIRELGKRVLVENEKN